MKVLTHKAQRPSSRVHSEVFEEHAQVQLRRHWTDTLRAGDRGFIVESLGEPPTAYIVEFREKETADMVSATYLARPTLEGASKRKRPTERALGPPPMAPGPAPDDDKP